MWKSNHLFLHRASHIVEDLAKLGSGKFTLRLQIPTSNPAMVRNQIPDGGGRFPRLSSPGAVGGVIRTLRPVYPPMSNEYNQLRIGAVANVRERVCIRVKQS